MLMCVCLGEWHNFADGFDPLSVVTCPASWTQSRDICGAANCEQKQRLSYDTCAFNGWVTWLLLLLKEGSFVFRSGTVTQTVVLHSLCMQRCLTDNKVWMWLKSVLLSVFLILVSSSLLQKGNIKHIHKLAILLCNCKLFAKKNEYLSQHHTIF